jgi:hypothetical protein
MFDMTPEQNGKNPFANLDSPMVRALFNDIRLKKVAEYQASKGYTVLKVDEQAFMDTFIEFKNLVRRGSFTLAQLEDDVYSRWGVQEGQVEPKEPYKKSTIGFHLNDIEVADIKEDSPKNH